MGTTLLPPGFKDFLKLLNSRKVRYLLIGGYAVGYHGYARATADMDLWIAMDPVNAREVVEALGEFGFPTDALEPGLFLTEGTTISGLSFEECYPERVVDQIDGVDVPIISLKHLKANKKASGRFKDLADLEHLE